DRFELTFEVTDTGVGIPQDKQREIFEAFTQADESTTRRFGGTGLGLTISSQLVGLMGGTLLVESEADAGSRFWFMLQLGVDREREPELRAASAPMLGKRALVVEPDPRHGQALAELLQSWGVDAVTADASQVWSKLRGADAARAPFSFLMLAEAAAASLGTSLADLRQRSRGLGIVLMTLATELDAARKGRLAHCSAQLTKPLVASELLETLTSLLAQPSARPEPRPRQEAPLEVLVVEDNEVNRRVACFLLESAGHRVVAVEDGRRALAVLAERPFDVVLMDGHMPQLDGVETTREIRARERETGQHTPIIALTAQALKGDRERYLAAGMDGYISKPFQSAQLLSTIREIVGQLRRTTNVSVATVAPRPTQPAAPAPASEAESGEAYQRDQLLARMRGAEHLLPQVVRVFAEDAPLLLDALARAVAARDVMHVQQGAHKLVGALLTVGGNRAGQLARAMENEARAGGLEDVDARMSDLHAEVHALLDAMERAGDLVRAPAATG
ncbi:MAG TPA: response regulator, partial [Polyangiales bacterium]